MSAVVFGASTREHRHSAMYGTMNDDAFDIAFQVTIAMLL